MLQAAVPVLRSKEAEAFYCGRLGFRLLFATRAGPATPDPCYMAVARGGAVLHLSSFPGDAVHGGVAYVAVDDVDALHAELRARGVPIDLLPTDQTWGAARCT